MCLLHYWLIKRCFNEDDWKEKLFIVFFLISFILRFGYLMNASVRKSNDSKQMPFSSIIVCLSIRVNQISRTIRHNTETSFSLTKILMKAWFDRNVHNIHHTHSRSINFFTFFLAFMCNNMILINNLFHFIDKYMNSTNADCKTHGFHLSYRGILPSLNVLFYNKWKY